VTSVSAQVQGIELIPGISLMPGAIVGPGILLGAGVLLEAGVLAHGAGGPRVCYAFAMRAPPPPRPERPAIENVLGPLGGAIARIVLEQGEATIASVVEALAEAQRRPAYTTVMTVMGRLYERGVLLRLKVGRQYVYRPATDEVRLVDALSGRAVDELIGRYGTAALRQFAQRLQDLDPELRAQ